MKTIKNHQGFKSRFGEFPDLLFATADARTYFGMAHFLQTMKVDTEEKITEFTRGFDLWINHLSEKYKVACSTIIKVL